MTKRIIMGKDEMKRIIKRLAAQILDDAHGVKDLVLVGIRSMGVYLAQRIKKEIERTEKKKIPLGILDITLYRDDFSRRPIQPRIRETVINFDLTGKHIVLVDDVIWSGRTVRAALDELIDFGRPDRVRLCVLMDRGDRELPVEPNFVGKRIEVRKNEWIELYMKEAGKRDEVLLLIKKNGGNR